MLTVKAWLNLEKYRKKTKMACNAPTRESDSGPLIRLGQNPLARALPPDTQGSGLSMWGAAELA